MPACGYSSLSFIFSRFLDCFLPLPLRASYFAAPCPLSLTVNNALFHQNSFPENCRVRPAVFRMLTALFRNAGFTTLKPRNPVLILYFLSPKIYDLRMAFGSILKLCDGDICSFRYAVFQYGRGMDLTGQRKVSVWKELRYCIYHRLGFVIVIVTDVNHVARQVMIYK